MLKRILGLVGWLGVALVLAALAISVLKPDWAWYRWLAIGGLVCTLLYVLSEWREMARVFSGREARFGTVAVLSALVVLGILVALNYLASRHSKRWDLTANKQFTLSDQTRKILEGLQKPVGIKVFAAPDDFSRFRDRLDQYGYASSQVSIEYIDAEKQRARAAQYQVQALGTVVFEYDGRTERVTADGEQELTNGLIKVVQGQQRKVYFVQGHGERANDSSDRTGYSTIASSLGSENYAVDKVVLAQQKDVPADTTVLIIAGPKADFFPPEIDMLKRYLAKGGKVLFMLDPPEKPEAGPDIPNLVALLKDWSIEVGTNVVVDAGQVGQLLGTGPEVPIAARYQPHPITERFGLLTAYPLARSIAPVAGSTSGKFAQTLVETSPRSWAETDLKELMTTGKVNQDPEKGDKAGPISLAAAVSSPAADTPAAAPDPKPGAKPDDTPKPETRLVVFGDSDFASNAGFRISGNRDLFLNVVNWLAQQENLISIRARDPADSRVTMTAANQTLVFWLTLFIIPGLLLVAGIHTWWRRR